MFFSWQNNSKKTWNNEAAFWFQEEEADVSDPSVTKIILSKEGGGMNSQDPHQCPICGRSALFIFLLFG